MKKTNTARILDRLNIHYKLVEYEVDESDLSAENAASKINLPLEQVFKTLIARGTKRVSCLPASPEGLNLI